MNSQKETEKKKESQEEIEWLYSEAMSEERMARDEVYVLMTERTLRKARALRIPTPPYSNNDAWESGYIPNVTYLSPKAQLELESSIRKELQERRGAGLFG